MSTVRFHAPEEAHIGALRRLWKEAFGDSPEFLDTFFETAFSPDRCRCAELEGQPVAALYWFDVTVEGKPLAYLYAVATAVAHRGKGIAGALLEDTHAHLRQKGYTGTLLVPGEDGLFSYYESLGYRVCSHITEFVCAPALEEVQLYRVDEGEYAALRRQYLPEGAAVQEGENLAFLATQAKLYAGQNFLLAARREEDTLFGEELLGDTAAAPAVLQALGCSSGTFRTPGMGQPFAMFHPLCPDAPVPAYFGLAFD